MANGSVPNTAQTVLALEDILLKQGLLSQSQASAIKLESINSGKTAEQIIQEHSLIPADKILTAKAQILNVPFVKLEGKAIQTQLLTLIPEAVARRYSVIPFDMEQDQLSVAMADPLDLGVIQFIEKKSGKRIKPYLASPAEIIKTIGEQYAQNLAPEVTSALQEVAESQPISSTHTEAPEVIKEAPVANIVNQLLEYAMKTRASDIHIEPEEDRTRVRYRIDGILQEKIILPKGVHEALISRIKIMSTLKIDERRLPQDGRFSFEFGGKETDIRVSTVPTVFGEKVVMRLLPKGGGAPTLMELGLRGSSLKNLETQLLRPHGIILITGPTGSGKTTTLYSILTKVSTIKVNVVTIEDPVEYQIPGVNQVQVNPQIGLTFASALRSFLRQDPNIIMVGEVRDTETAELAIQAALTGHQVFSTVHTNSAAGAAPRLLDMGVEPFLLTSALNVAVGQRVVRKICPSCRVQYDAPPEVIENIKATLGKLIPQNQPFKLFKGAGCPKCNSTGYLGRVGIYEVLVVTEGIIKLILERASIQNIENAAIQHGMITMKQDGYLKVLEGVTTMEEVLRVAQD
ncbi:MAG: Flp pilus assembly complex ATPase component TadA [Candidatus Daviesbacteria bacterium]|nr:MAG: Flp pilus assembly complex ATPase component TadA [Candidatus Daviesbacteria bacterium]